MASEEVVSCGRGAPRLEESGVWARLVVVGIRRWGRKRSRCRRWCIGSPHVFRRMSGLGQRDRCAERQSRLRRISQRAPDATGSKESLHFLGMASGSLAETGAILILAQRSNSVAPDQATPVLVQAAEVGWMLTGLQRSLNSRTKPPTTSALSATHAWQCEQKSICGRLR